MEQISDFKLSIKLSAIRHYQMNIIEKAITKKIVKNFDRMKYFKLAQAGQSLGLPSCQATGNTQAKEKSELFWPSFPIP